jgi:hypothetical protein
MRAALDEARCRQQIFVRGARRYRTLQIRAGGPVLTAHDPLPLSLREALLSDGDPIVRTSLRQFESNNASPSDRASRNNSGPRSTGPSSHSGKRRSVRSASSSTSVSTFAKSSTVTGMNIRYSTPSRPASARWTFTRGIRDAIEPDLKRLVSSMKIVIPPWSRSATPRRRGDETRLPCRTRGSATRPSTPRRARGRRRCTASPSDCGAITDAVELQARVPRNGTRRARL